MITNQLFTELLTNSTWTSWGKFYDHKTAVYSVADQILFEKSVLLTCIVKKFCYLSLTCLWPITKKNCPWSITKLFVIKHELFFYYPKTFCYCNVGTQEYFVINCGKVRALWWLFVINHWKADKSWEHFTTKKCQRREVNVQLFLNFSLTCRASWVFFSMSLFLWSSLPLSSSTCNMDTGLTGQRVGQAGPTGVWTCHVLPATQV